MKQKSQKRIIFGIFLGCYCLLCGALLAWIVELPPQQPPQIEEIVLSPSGKSIEITGKNLHQSLDAIITPKNFNETSLVAKRFTWGDVFDIQIHKGIAWAANHKKGIIAYNIDTPSKPYAISSLELPRNARVWRITITDHYLITSSTRSGLYIIDIANPEAPELISSLQIPGITNQILVKDNLAFVAAGNSGLQVIDIKDKKNPRIISSLPLDAYVFTVCGNGNLIFLSGGRISNSKDIGITHCIDIANPENPVEIKKFCHHGRVWDSLIVNKTLYCGTASGVTKIILENLDQKPEKVTQDIYISRLHAHKNKLFVVSRDQKIYQYIIGDQLIYQNTFHSPRRTCRAIAILKNYALIASNAQGISVIDINKPSDEKKPILSTNSSLTQKKFFFSYKNYIGIIGNKRITIAYRQDKNNSYSIIEKIKFDQIISSTAQNENIIYISVNNKGIYAINLDKDNNFIDKNFLSCKRSIKSMTVYDNKLYICLHKGNAIVADISNTQPVLINDNKLTLAADFITFGNNKAFVKLRGSNLKKFAGISVYDLSNNKLSLTSQINSDQALNQTNASNGIFLKGNTLLMCGSRGVVTIDISDLEHPEFLDSVEFTESCESAQVVEDIVYINHTQGGLSFVDIKHPRRIKKLGHLDSPDRAWVLDDQLFMFDKAGDMTVTSVPFKLIKSNTQQTRCTFELPKNFTTGQYDVFFSDKKGYIRVDDALSFSVEKGWKINSIDVKKAYEFPNSI